MIALIDAILIIASAIGILALIFSPNGRKQMLNFWRNKIGGSYDALRPLINTIGPLLQPAISDVTDAFKTYGPLIYGTVLNEFANLAEKGFVKISTGLTGHRVTHPTDWQNNAKEAMRDAFSFGMASGATTSVFEAIFPEKLNVLNGVGPTLATMAGFAEVTDSWLRPMLDASIGRPARYDANQRTRSVQLEAQFALNLYSRGIITEAAARQFLAYAGHPDADITSLLTGAFRGAPPFAMAASLSDGTIDDAVLRRSLTYSGIHPESQDLLIHAFHQRLQQPYRQSALRALKTAFQRGVITQDEFNSGLNTLNVPTEVRGYIQLETGYVKLVELTDLYRRSLDTAAEYNLITLADYEPQLEAIGIDKADADAHTAIISNKVRGKTLAQEEREAAAEARRARAIRTRAAEAEYLAGELNDVTFVATLVGIGWDAVTASVILAAVKARKQAQLKLIYGLWLLPAQALLLKERVAVILENLLKLHISGPTALAALKALNIPVANATALVLETEAKASKKG